MLRRKYLFPRVIEMNYQAGRRLGVNVYLLDGGSEFVLIDVGYLDSVDEIVELIRQMDFNLSTCKMLIATHADADHVQGIARAKDLLKAKIAGHPATVEPLETGDPILTFASIKAQGIEIPMPRCKIDILLNEGDTIAVGDLKVAVWHTPGHTSGQLSFKMGNLLFSGDNIYKDSLRRRDRRPSRLEPAGIHLFSEAHPRRRRRVSTAEPRARVPQGSGDSPEGDRSSDGVPVHGRFRHLRRRLAAAGRVGERRERGEDAGVSEVGSRRSVCVSVTVVYSMTLKLTSLPELNRRAYAILSRELGVLDTVRFFGQLGLGTGNYTEERAHLVRGIDP